MFQAYGLWSLNCGLLTLVAHSIPAADPSKDLNVAYVLMGHWFTTVRPPSRPSLRTS